MTVAVTSLPLEARRYVLIVHCPACTVHAITNKQVSDFLQQLKIKIGRA
jgi:hypothetical protein